MFRTLKISFAFALTLALTLTMSVTAKAQKTHQDWLRTAVRDVCPAGPQDSLSVQQALPGAWFLNETVSPQGQAFSRQEQHFALPDGELHITRIDTGGELRRFTAEIFLKDSTKLEPFMQVQTDATCTPRSSRRIIHQSDGRVVLEQLDDDLETLLWKETMQAPWPQGSEPKGPRVALIDSGLAYDLPMFQNRLARDAKGKPLGYDFWDLDPLPYDGDTSRNVFQPIRHGTPVASILVREAPDAALIPFRYPRPDMARMGDLIDQIAKTGARIISMPLGSTNPKSWVAFEKAMRAHPQLLAIVSAGNSGHNVDAAPLWPGALELDNMIVVTSSDDFGRLAEGSNWGASSVDLMVPAENQPVIDFRGSKGRASGTSYAVPRLAALAARLLAAKPTLTTKDLKEEIFARAIPPRGGGQLVSKGWIVDPDRD